MTTTDDVPPIRADALAPWFSAVDRALDEAGVRWLRLRDRDGGFEDDLLVAADDLPAARRALAAVGWRERRHLGRGSHRAFHAHDGATGAWLKLDIVTALDFGRWHAWRTGLAAGCLDRRASTPDGPRPAPDDAFWTLVLHELLDRPGSPPRRAATLRRLAIGARMDGPLADASRPLLPRGTGPDALIDAALELDPGALHRLGLEMSRRLERRPTIVARGLVTRTLRAIDRLDPPFLRRGPTIALLGPDGAGKSSLTRRIGRTGPMPTRSVYLGLYGGARAGTRRGRVPGIGLLRRLVAMWRGWLVGWWQARRGRLVIFDRHPYDARLGGGVRGPLARIGRAILGHALPAPDVVIVLDAPAELLYARKPEHPLERIELQRRRYLELARGLGAIVVDARPPVDDVARTITHAAWDHGTGTRPGSARAR